MEIKIMLSMPRTISRAVRVPSAIHASGLVNHANIKIFSVILMEALFSKSTTRTKRLKPTQILR